MAETTFYNECIEWCINKHKETNHWYDKYLPYEFHLRMVNKVAEDFGYLIKDSDLLKACKVATWGHDLIEDCRVSFNDVNKKLGEVAANIVYAVTNEKGKNRKERANAAYYEGIRNTPGAVFVKLCDRIANVQYGKMTGSGMVDKYRRENEYFLTGLGYYEDAQGLEPMFDYLVSLFE